MPLRGRVVIETLDSEVLRGNRPGDPTRREIPLYLPPSYDTSSDRRWPAIYMLNGFTGTGLTYLNHQWRAPNLPTRVDDLMASGAMQEAIVVMADGMNRYGGSQYVDSSASGRYQTFLADETVAYVDARFRTVARREARAVVGKSSGGYGALMAGMQRADVFGAVGCHSGDMYFEYCYGLGIPDAVSEIGKRGSVAAWLAWFEQQAKIRSHAEFSALSIVAMSAAWSPDESGDGDGLGFWLPFDAQGERREHVLAQWRTSDPVFMVERHADALRTLSLLYIECGDRDEFNLHLGSRMLVERLKRHGIAHRYEEFADGHKDTSYRYSVSLPMISAVLARS